MPRPERIGAFEIHPAASQFPLMPEAELEQLAEDIRTRGQEFPIVLHEGKVLDGRNRLLACQRAGVEPTTTEWTGAGGSAVAYVVSANVKRRHLTESQRAMVAAELLPFFEREAKARQRDHGGTAPGRRRSDENTERPGARSDAPRAKAAEQAAQAASVATRSVERAKFVAKSSPELADQVREGKATLKQAEKQIRRLEQVEKISAYEPPKGRFNLIVADPPWKYDDALDGSDEARGGLPYPPMELLAIKQLEVPADDDCVLFLWVTNAHLLDGSAHQVLFAWDFAPKAIITWNKVNMGAGRWIRNVTEHVILATRGSPKVTLTNQTSLIRAPRREHSRKPDEFWALVDSLCPQQARLEMFSRESRPGWVTSGAEATKFDEPEVMALSEFCREAKEKGFRAKASGRALTVECLACGSEFNPILTEHHDVPRGARSIFEMHTHDRKPKKGTK